jgi:hypothetical protein
MWGWLKAILSALFEALFSWGQKQAEKPPEIRDANTPENIKRGWNGFLSDRLRDKNNDRH